MPVLHVVAGPNGSGKTTYCERVLIPATHLPFINADEFARRRWPRRSFIAETVFSHPSKLELLQNARDRGYLTNLHVMLVPEALAVARVGLRADQGGHSVPTAKIRARYRRLWSLLRHAVALAGDSAIYDNSSVTRPFHLIAQYRNGVAEFKAGWPKWSPIRW